MVKTAKRAAKKSRHKKSKHGAVLIKSGRVLASAQNNNGHAEAVVMSKIKDLPMRTIVWSVRVMADGSLGMAKPCRACESIMRELGVKTVYYSTASGNIRQMNLRGSDPYGASIL